MTAAPRVATTRPPCAPVRNRRHPRPDCGNIPLTDLEYRLLLAARAAHAAGQAPTAGELGRRAGFTRDEITDQRRALQGRGLWPWGLADPPKRVCPANPSGGKTGTEFAESAALRRAAAAMAADLAARALIGLTGGLRDDDRASYLAPAWSCRNPGEFRGFHSPERTEEKPTGADVVRGFVAEWRRARRARRAS